MNESKKSIKTKNPKITKSNIVSAVTGNREYKDSLFTYLFGNEKYKNLTLDLYNAVNGTEYTDSDELEITTLEKVVYINVKNDVSFLLAAKMNFYEHQSTYNPNIPVRMLIYASKVYDRYISERKYNIYGQNKFELPVPKCVCFYNGTKEMEDRAMLKLSDSFGEKESGDIEVKVTVLNINHGHNKELLKACRALEEYAKFVKDVRKNCETAESLGEAITRAIEHFPEDSVIGEILKRNKSEVISMCLEEYTQEYADELHQMELEKVVKEKNEAVKEKNEAVKEKDEAVKDKDKMTETAVKSIQLLLAGGTVTLNQALDSLGLEGEERENLKKKILEK